MPWWYWLLVGALAGWAIAAERMMWRARAERDRAIIDAEHYSRQLEDMGVLGVDDGLVGVRRTVSVDYELRPRSGK